VRLGIYWRKYFNTIIVKKREISSLNICLREWSEELELPTFFPPSVKYNRIEFNMVNYTMYFKASYTNNYRVL